MKLSKQLVLGLALVAHLAIVSASGDDDDEEHAIEWAGAFQLDLGTAYTWRAEKTGCPNLEYVDPAMKMVIYKLPNCTTAGLNSVEHEAEEMMENPSITQYQAPQSSITVNNGDWSGQIVFDQNSDVSLWPLTVDETGCYGIFCEHSPIEFELDNHYIYQTDNGEDVEPLALHTGEEVVGHDGGHGDHGHGHDDEDVCDTSSLPDCYCTAAGIPDCRNTDEATKAFQYLEDNSCLAGCNCRNEMACAQAFFTVQAYHDACGPDAISTEIEQEYHSYEEKCQKCFVPLHQTPELPDCPSPTCDNSTYAEAEFEYLKNNCANDNTGPNPDDQCLSDRCQSAWQEVMSFHDGCCATEIPTVIEVDIHDWEEKCKGGCNVPNDPNYSYDCEADKNKLYAVSESSSSSSSSSSNNSMSSGAVAGIVVAVCVVVFGLGFFLFYQFYLKQKTRDDIMKEPQKMEDRASAAGLQQPSTAV